MPNEETPEGSRRRSVSDDRERYRALVAVLTDEERRERAVAPPPPAQRVPAALWVVFGLTVFVAAWSWFGSPPWLSREPPRTSLTDQEFFMRVALHTRAVRLDAFLAANDSLPETLAGLPGPGPSVEYTRLPGDRYQLAIVQGPIAVRYDSSRPPRTLLTDFEPNVGGAPDEEPPPPLP